MAWWGDHKRTEAEKNLRTVDSAFEVPMGSFPDGDGSFPFSNDDDNEEAVSLEDLHMRGSFHYDPAAPLPGETHSTHFPSGAPSTANTTSPTSNTTTAGAPTAAPQLALDLAGTEKMLDDASAQLESYRHHRYSGLTAHRGSGAVGDQTIVKDSVSCEAGPPSSFERALSVWVDEDDESTASVTIKSLDGKTRAAVLFKKAVAAHGVAKILSTVTAEHEGADAVLFRHVPKWIEYTRVRGCRFRLVKGVHDPGDFMLSMQSKVTFTSHPGASGWADNIGAVAIHYFGVDWFVFSKILPFREQKSDRDEHEDILLLGTSRHVMLTPECLYYAPIGLRAPEHDDIEKDDSVLIITSQGGPVAKCVRLSDLTTFSKFRLYISWGHANSDFAAQVEEFKTIGIEQLEEAQRLRGCEMVNVFRVAWQNWSGNIRTLENISRYPLWPIDPAYYERLLCAATWQTEDEFRARKLMRARSSLHKVAVPPTEGQRLQSTASPQAMPSGAPGGTGGCGEQPIRSFTEVWSENLDSLEA